MDLITTVGSPTDIHFWTADRRIHVGYTSMSDSRGGDVRAQAEVHWNEPGVETSLIKHGYVTLQGTVSAWPRELAKLTVDLTEREWGQIIQHSSFLALRHYRKGEPFEFIGDPPKPESYLMRPLVAGSGPTVVSAQGGSTKSFLALAVALTVATGSPRFLGIAPQVTGPVLYLDWEDSKNTHDRRAWALCRRFNIDPPRESLIYLRQRTGLAYSVRHLKEKIVDLPNPPVLVVIDSIGKARGGDPNSAEDTNKLFAAIDQLEIPTFCIDHKSRSAISRGEAGPIGSVYTWNSARMVWDVEKSQFTGQDALRIVAKNVKSNSSRLHRALAWEITFTTDDVTDDLYSVKYEKIEAATVDVLDQSQMRTVDAILSLLSHSEGALTVAEIAGELGKSEEAVRKALLRSRSMFSNVGHANRGLWTTVERDGQVQLPANIMPGA